jgi:putative tryptophan/tyrosine transport system substrate-binding protein
MRRREFMTLIGSAGAWPVMARAQQVEGKRLIGVLMGVTESNPAAQSQIAAFRDQLTKLGWKEGTNLRIETRWSTADADTMRTFAKELVDLRPDAILGRSTPETSALARETRTIPIVFAIVSDPIASGFAANLAQPGRNITGFTNVEATMGGKWLQLLKEVAPRTVRVAVLYNPTTAPPLKFYMPSIQEAASSFGIEASAAPVHVRDEIQVVIAAQARNPGGGLIVMPDAFNVANRELIINLTARFGLPSICDSGLYAKSGGLAAYGVDLDESLRRAAGYIDRILKGARIMELPIQLPTKFLLVINLRVAKALGLDVPLRLQQLADEVIE